MRSDSLAFLKALVNAPSPSGYEEPAARCYRDYTSAFADDVTTDVHGNVMAVLNPDSPMKIMLAGHMDEIGFIIHHIGEEGLLSFSGIGGHDSVIPDGQRVWIHGRERIPGVVGRKAIHLLSKAELEQKSAMHELWIDIGATSRAQAEALVKLGDVITFQYEFEMLVGDRAAARAFDNKAGVFIVAEALRLLREQGGLDPRVAVYGVATVQEEIGSRGARTAAFSIAPQVGLAVDMDHAVDYPGVSSSRYGRLDMGKGPCLTRGPNTNHALFALLTQAAGEEDIPYQIRVSAAATPTDANAMEINRSGMAAGLVSIPLRYMHTPCEVLSLRDVEDCARLIAACCRRITPETDFTPR